MKKLGVFLMVLGLMVGGSVAASAATVIDFDAVALRGANV